MENNVTQDFAWNDAQEVVKRAAAAGAERIVFIVEGEFLFTQVSVEQVFNLIKEASPHRYKLQIINKGRWADITKYRAVSSGSIALESLRKGDIESALEMPVGDVARAAASDPGGFHFALKNLLRELNSVQTANRSAQRLENILTLLDGVAKLRKDPHLNYARATVDLYKSVTKLKFATFPSGSAIDRARSELLNRIESDLARYSTVEAQIAVQLMLGKLSSLQNRTVAAQHFEEVRRLDNLGLIDYFYIDMGAMTYFSGDSLGSLSRNLAHQIRNNITALKLSSSGNEFGVLMSVDRNFFRIYAHSILYYAQQMPNVDYNIIICETEEDSRALLELTKNYLDALNSMNLSGFPSNLSFYYTSVPKFVSQEKTFFASARFFATQAALERHSNVYVMDADLTTNLDPRPYFERIQHIAFGAPQEHNFDSFSPWRRHKAGNLALNRDVLHTSLLQDFQTYLAYGLSQPSNWMLDQNALLYAIERNNEHYSDLTDFNRPFRQPKFRSSWEQTYWRALAPQAE